MIEYGVSTGELKSPEGERFVDTPTPSEVLVRKIAERHITPVDEVQHLLGERIKLMGYQKNGHNEETVGEVLSVSGRSLLVLPEFTNTLDQDLYAIKTPITDPTPRIAHAYFLSEDPYGVGFVEYEDPGVTNAVYEYIPKRISIWRDSDVLIGFDGKDPSLDAFLEKALQRFPTIKTKADIAALTSWIYNEVPYRNYEKPKDISYTPRLGKELTAYGSVCRQIAALSIAVLELRDIACVPISNTSPQGKGHMYVGIDEGIEGQTERIIVDPTWNVSGTYTEVLQQLAQRKSSQMFHRPLYQEDLEMGPDWSYAGTHTNALFTKTV